MQYRNSHSASQLSEKEPLREAGENCNSPLAPIIARAQAKTYPRRRAAKAENARGLAGGARNKKRGFF